VDSMLLTAVSRRQPRYPVHTPRAGGFASLPYDSFAYLEAAARS
jgi:hypothetical protein